MMASSRAVRSSRIRLVSVRATRAPVGQSACRLSTSSSSNETRDWAEGQHSSADALLIAIKFNLHAPRMQSLIQVNFTRDS